MTMRTGILKALGVGAAVVLFSGGAAFASVVSAPASLYSGPGTHYRVISELTVGEDVNVVRTQGNWCLVNAPMRGWAPCGDIAEVSADMLGLNLFTGPGRAPPPFAQPEFTGPAVPHAPVQHEHHHNND